MSETTVLDRAEALTGFALETSMPKNLLDDKNPVSPIANEELTDEQQRKLQIMCDRLEVGIRHAYDAYRKEVSKYKK